MSRQELRLICKSIFFVGIAVSFIQILAGISEASTPKFPGFDFTLSEGTYWEFYWTYKKTSYVQGEGGSTDVDTGSFRITLGPPKTIGGVTSYEVLLAGDSTDPSHDYAPRWKYIAINNNQILGSVDEITLQVIFDANDGEWQGGGFFTTFSAQSQIAASNGQIDNEFVQTSAIAAGRSANQDFCEIIAGYTVCPNDEEFTVAEKDYYKGGIGPLGYYLYLGFSSSGGDFYTSFTYTRHLGLIATSLRADDGFVPKLPPWTKKADMLTPRENHSTAVLDGKIYVIGGTKLAEGNLLKLDSVEIYNPKTDTWTTGTPMPEARSSHSSVSVNGKIYVVGGYVGKPLGSQVVYPSTLEYDPLEDSWTRKAPLPEKEVPVISDAMGGYIWVFPDDTTTVYAYEVLADTWWYGTARPVSYHGSTASGVDGKIYLIGGLSYSTFRSTCLQFDLFEPYGSPDAWTYKMSMPTERNSLTSAVLGGKIYAIGGFNYGAEQRAVEEYDPATNTWKTIESMLTPREYLASVVVAGKIYVIGGRKDNESLATVEAYNPPDFDGDGLADFIENDSACLKPDDSDTDDDGISDGIEDANQNGELDRGETDPCNNDSDGDGIQDGTEIGITEPVLDPDGTGPLFGTDPGVFVPDADPATTTDPLNNDTDGDGLSDGEEDPNHNGKIDQGEKDPLVYNVRAMPWIPLLLQD